VSRAGRRRGVGDAGTKRCIVTVGSRPELRNESHVIQI